MNDLKHAAGTVPMETNQRNSRAVDERLSENLSAACLIANLTWKSAPPMCSARWVLAFETMDDLKKYYNRNCPRHRIKRTGKCGACSHFHAETEGP